MTNVVAWLFAAAALSVVTSLLCTVVMTHALKSRFPAVWRAEGEPVRWLWLQPTPVSGHVFGFLDERRYLATGSVPFRRYCAALRAGWYLSLALAAAALIAGVAWATFGQA